MKPRWGTNVDDHESECCGLCGGCGGSRVFFGRKFLSKLVS